MAREVAVDIMDLAVIMDLSKVPKPNQKQISAKYKTISFRVLFLWGLNGKEQIQLLKIHLEI